MNRIYIRDYVTVTVLVFKQECAEVWLAALHHVFDSSNDGRIPNDNSFVETRKEGSSSNGKRKDLRIVFGGRLPGYRPGVGV
jgi:hypothetical protein